MEILHRPVMVREVIEYLEPKDGGVYFDGTVGNGGHAEAILEAIPGADSTVIGVDIDPEAADTARSRLSRYGERAKIYHRSYTEIEEVIEEAGFSGIDGIILDLGMGLHQLNSEDRGFSIDRGGPLDMRYDAGLGTSAREVVNRFPEKELIRIIRDFGEERRARSVARGIVRAREKRPIEDSKELAEIVRVSLGYSYRSGGRSRIHPATRTFMALRIYVNNELSNIEEFIPKGVGLLKTGGRIVIISFHSLEDRIVKLAFRDFSKSTDDGTAPLLTLLTKKPLSPDMDEIRENPRARSAKLRAAERIGDGR
jgi:16S rRNA (cytosine1402-N4)-methyltransferase